ncbi:tetratricopeptide repeat protein [Rhodohalobacter sulfatireducens]|uniref:Tetratricopeptide repeat protein n=1 Tax=Rhodohalobacter sulfatireducens TaxID=2911366 RepID=A0ABS9KC06_9BACT|nr:tetratricopeptide repeat protein [Rhodohalobacter sulfatireducens]MCG2588387.1 tetratricopeptide repeat protein [Rhodohalobacter sulfatireducens]
MSRNLISICILVSVLFYSYEGVAQNNQASPRETFQTGLTLFEKGLYSEAIPYFEEVSRDGSNTLIKETAAYYRTRALTRIDSTGTNKYVDDFLQAYPGSNQTAVLLRDLAEKHLRIENYDEAIRRMDEALNFPQSYDDKAELYYTLGETAAEAGEFDLARDYFLALDDTHGRSVWAPRALYARGRLYLEEESYSDASEAFELLRERHPQNAMTRRIGTALGESYYQQRKFEEAIEAFLDALPYLDDENRAKAVYLTAESYNAINNYEDATRFYRRYLNLIDDPEQSRIAHYGLGWVFHKQDIYHWAARSFGEASSGEDEIAIKAQYYEAVNQKLAGRYQESLNSFREFGDRFQEGIFQEQARFEWAVTAFESGLYNEAIEVLLPLAREYETLENPGQLLTFLGEVFYANNEYTRSMETFQLAEEITDLDPALKRQARFQRAWVLYYNQAYEQAQPDFEQVHEQAPNSDLGSEALFWSADANFQIEEFGQAATQFNSFIRQYPEHELVGAAKYSLGWTYFKMGDFGNATAPLIDFLNNYEPPPIVLYPYETDTKLRIGDSFFAQGEYQQALEYYRDTIGAEPGGDYAMYQVANSYYRMNRNFEAVTEFRRLLRIYPFSSLREQAAYNIAYVYLNTGNYDQAIEEFRSVISRYPNTEWAARAQYNIGDSYYNAGQYEEAIEAYQTVLEEYPRSDYIIEAIDGIEYAQLSTGSEDTSTDVLEGFLADNPTSTTADRLRFRQAENVFQTGDYEAAVREFRQYLRVTNNRELMPEAYYNLADAYTRTDSLEQASDALLTLVNEFPNSERTAPAFAELGRLQNEMGNYNRSLNYYQQLLENDERYQQEAYLGIGNAQLQLGNINEARQNFERVLSINSENNAARLGVGKVLMQDGRQDEARRFFQLVAENSTTEIGAEAQYLLGESYQSEGDRESALEAYSRVSVLFETFDEWVAEAQYKTAEIYIRQGNRGEATNLLNSIVETYPDTPGAQKARRLLQSN